MYFIIRSQTVEDMKQNDDYDDAFRGGEVNFPT